MVRLVEDLATLITPRAGQNQPLVKRNSYDDVATGHPGHLPTGCHEFVIAQVFHDFAGHHSVE